MVVELREHVPANTFPDLADSSSRRGESTLPDDTSIAQDIGYDLPGRVILFDRLPDRFIVGAEVSVNFSPTAIGFSGYRSLNPGQHSAGHNDSIPAP
ncbi:MAG: hypothetical protein ACRYFU_04450 [Janthinobacterium lividum]